LTGCESLRERQVIERTDPNRDSITQVRENYDTWGRRWGKAEVVQEVTPAPKPSPRPTPTPAPARAPQNRACASITTGLVNMTMNLPAEASVGQEILCELNPTAVNCAANVVVTQRIPSGFTYLRSEPEAQRQGDLLTWRLDEMDPGASRPIKVWLRAEQEGRL